VRSCGADFLQDILDSLQDVALGRRNATLEEAMEAKGSIAWCPTIRWLAGVFSGALDSAHYDPKQATTELDSRRNRT